MPRVKDASKPKGRMTAYAYFMQVCRQEQKKTSPDEKVAFMDFSRQCAERWKTVSEKEKKLFLEMSIRDKMRYDLEMEDYVPPPPKAEKGRAKKLKQKKDPNAPKRPLSAFFWFSGDQRAVVKGMNPEYSLGETAKEIGRLWREGDPALKRKYMAMAEKDKARYEREMMIYKVREAAARAQNDDDVDDDDEESEEDE